MSNHSTNANMQGNSNQSILQKLPVETLDRVADFLDNRSLAAFRKTAKFVERNTFENFIGRRFETMEIDLTTSGIEQALSDIEPYHIASKVNTIVFTDSQSFRYITADERSSTALTLHVLRLDNGDSIPCVADAQEFEGEQLYELIKKLFSKVRRLKEVRIRGVDALKCVRLSTRSMAFEQLLRVLRETSTRLTSLQMELFATSVTTLTTVLGHHQKSLKSLHMSNVGCLHGHWQGFLSYVRDQMTLEQLYLANPCNYSGWMVGFKHALGEERSKSAAHKSTITNKIEHYRICSSEARMMGAEAVTRGLQVLLPDQPYLMR